MKKTILFLAALQLSLLSCSFDSSGPENAVRNFTENISKGKLEDAKNFATEPTGKMLDFSGKFGVSTIDPNFKFELIKDSIVENLAWVTFENQNGKVETMQVVKIDNEWLVNIDAKK